MDLKWNNFLETGNENIDNQHKKLFNMINSFVKSIDTGMGKQEILKTLDFLEEYAVKHFIDEEKLQQETSYPKYAIQCAQHEHFKNQLNDVRYLCNNYGISGTVANNLKVKLTDFWEYHINNLDKDLAKYIKEISITS